MSHTVLLFAALAAFLYAAVARRLSTTPLTGPLLFLALGFALHAVGLIDTEVDSPLDLLAEVALALVLFADAARTDLSALIRSHLWPARTLLLGLPLAILLGWGAALLLLPDWPVWEAALLAAILAPTDAALGQAVVSSSALPERVRRCLTVESGLNDGLALPAVLLFASLAAAQAEPGTAADWLLFIVGQIGFGAVAGLVPGLLLGRLAAAAIARRLMAEETEGVAALAAAGCCYALAEALGGNAFIACFAGGLAFGRSLQAVPRGGHPFRSGGFLGEFLENEGQLLVLAAFLLVGSTFLPPALEHLGWRAFALVLASLFAVRPLAIWLSLIGTDASPGARLFIGWFGPRGLATALFALLAVDATNLSRSAEILAIAALAVALSAALHGLTAAPAAARFGPRLRTGPPPT